MRLLFLSNVFPSPVHPTKGVFNLGLVRALVELGHDLSVIAPIAWTDWIRAPRPRRQATRQTTELPNGAPVHYPVYFYTPGVLRSAYGHFMWHSIRATVVDAIAQKRPQAVIGYWAHPDGQCANHTARHAGIPSVVMVGGSDILLLTENRGRRRDVYRVLENADAVVAVSHDLMRKIVGGGIDAHKVHVVRRGIDTKRFRPGDRQDARRRLDLPNNRPMLLWVGRMEPEKGLPVLLDAIQILQDDGMEFKTVLVGAGAGTAAILAEAQRRGLSQRITMPGAVPHEKLADYFRAADLVVLPSLSEGVPNVLLESIACGTPFVASHVGGIPEIASPGIDRLVPPGEPRSLAAAIRAQLLAPQTASTRSFVPEDWPTAASRLIDVIQPLIDNRSTQQLEDGSACLTHSIV